MVIIFVLILLLGIAFIAHTIRILSLNKKNESPPQGFEKVFAVLGGILIIAGVAGIAVIYFS